MEIVDIVKLISDAGISIVLLGVAIWYVVKLLLNRQKSDEKDIKRLEKFENDQQTKSQHWEELIADLVVEKLHGDHLKEEPVNNATNERITDIMQSAMHEVQCTRVLHFSYHNGGRDYEGRSYQRMSCINEVIQNGSYPIQEKYSNMFRTSIFTLYKELNNNNYFNIPDIEEIKDSDPGTYYTLKQDNINALFGSAIHNRNGAAIGSIIFCFAEPINDYKPVISVLKRCVYQIEGVYISSCRGE